MTDHHICFNPRVWKEAFYYEKKGANVVILSMWIGQEYLEKDLEILRHHSVIYKPFLNLIPGNVMNVTRFIYRARKRFCGEMQRLFQVGLPAAISYAPYKMFRSAMRENADLYSAHLECAFVAGVRLLRKDKNVSFDFEDWYSQDYLVPERPVKLLQYLERSALENALFWTCTSFAMERALRGFYGTSRPEGVIYNGFPFDGVKGSVGEVKQESKPVLRLIWFSRSIGPDRGIEPFLHSLSASKYPIEVHFLGMMEPEYERVLKGFGIHNIAIITHSFINHSELIPFISKFDVGLAIDIKVNRNRNVTITNKILQYLQAGLPVLASDTEGHREVAAYFPQRIKVVDVKDTEQVNEAVLRLKEVMPGLSLEEERKFEEIFSWKAQEKKFDGLVSKHYELSLGDDI